MFRILTFALPARVTEETAKAALEECRRIIERNPIFLFLLSASHVVEIDSSRGSIVLRTYVPRAELKFLVGLFMAMLAVSVFFSLIFIFNPVSSFMGKFAFLFVAGGGLIFWAILNLGGVLKHFVYRQCVAEKIQRSLSDRI